MYMGLTPLGVARSTTPNSCMMVGAAYLKQTWTLFCVHTSLLCSVAQLTKVVQNRTVHFHVK